MGDQTEDAACCWYVECGSAPWNMRIGTVVGYSQGREGALQDALLVAALVTALRLAAAQACLLAPGGDALLCQAGARPTDLTCLPRTSTRPACCVLPPCVISQIVGPPKPAVSHVIRPRQCRRRRAVGSLFFHGVCGCHQRRQGAAHTRAHTHTLGNAWSEGALRRQPTRSTMQQAHAHTDRSVRAAGARLRLG